ncbi:hypothetical protein HHK36_019417 [Tetracentron sinense]|uniref:TatD related DNase n=1 Tax=Tetracentron sinense TaxID=13715 RepID=A0A834YZ65_TETSI|nr:hypothetical protein HHK36_019417 [Tetracentron sinense]
MQCKSYTDSMFKGIYNGKQSHVSDIAAVLSRAWSAGVDRIIVTGGSLEESKEALAIAEMDGPPLILLFIMHLFASCLCLFFCREAFLYGWCASYKMQSNVFFFGFLCFCFCLMYCSLVGDIVSLAYSVSIQEFEESGDPEQHFQALVSLAREGVEKGKVVAIGECGLDYDRLHFCPSEIQKTYFEKQFELADAMKLPMFLHMRAAAEDFCDILVRNKERFSAGVVHSFTGSAEDRDRLLQFSNLFIGKYSFMVDLYSISSLSALYH